MESLGQYIVSVAAAAILCGIVRSIAGEKGAGSGVIRLVCGIFLAFVVIRPVRDIQLPDVGLWLDSFSAQAQEASAMGENLSREAMADIIKARTAAYILDKGEELGLDLTVEVTVSEDQIPAPVAVTIRGSASPANKTKLQNWIQEELGIPKEDQQWTA